MGQSKKKLKTIRAFISLDLTNEAQENIYNIYKAYKRDQVKIRWVSQNNLHLTLVFLGNITPNEIEKITNILNSLSLEDNKPLSWQLTEINAFPSINHPKILWIGSKQPQDLIESLYKDLFLKLKRQHIKIKKEKQFIPHITIGRIKTITKEALELAQKLNMLEFNLSLRLKTISLYESQLTPSGPIYNVLYTKQLT